MSFPLQLKNGTAAAWTSANPVLAVGETGVESDTGLYKIGDGTTTWTSLLYAGTNYFRLTADGSAIGTAATDFFASGAITLAAAAIYELEYELYFLKTTAGTVTFTLVAAQAPVNLNAYYEGGPVAGVATAGAPITAAIKASTSTTTTIPATSSLTTAVEHHFRVKTIIETHATNAGTFKIQAAESAGTITPRRGSYYKVTRLPGTNIGAFA